MTESLAKALNDYFMIAYEKKFFEDRLKIRPLAGGFIVSDWEDIENNYSIIYTPEISYQATDNAEITLSTVIYDGKGDNMFANLSDFNMFMFKMKYSFTILFMYLWSCVVLFLLGVQQ